MKKQKDNFVLNPGMKSSPLGYTDNFPLREMWKEIAEELNAKFTIKTDASHGLEIHTLRFIHHKTDIKVTVSDTQPLKFYFAFESHLDFKFVLNWEDIIERIINKFSKPKIEMGWNEFDKHYLIKSNRADLVKRFLTKDIQATLLRHNVYSISIQSNAEKGKGEFISVIQRQAGEKREIQELIEMHKSLVDGLYKARIIH